MIIHHLSIGVGGGTVHILGDGFKSMASQFLSKDISINELNPEFYYVLCIFGGLSPEKPPAFAEIYILIEFLKQNKNCDCVSKTRHANFQPIWWIFVVTVVFLRLFFPVLDPLSSLKTFISKN